MEYSRGRDAGAAPEEGRAAARRRRCRSRFRLPTRSTRRASRRHRPPRSEAWQHHARRSLASPRLLDFGRWRKCSIGLATASAAAVVGCPSHCDDDAAPDCAGHDPRHLSVHGARAARRAKRRTRAPTSSRSARVLYEMLTGRKAFEGNSHATLIGAILKDDPPPISTFQPLTPPVLDHVVKRCLAKQVDDRWQAASDVMRELKWAAEAGSQSSAAVPAPPRRRPVLLTGARVAWMVAAIAVVSAIAVGWWGIRTTTPQPLRGTLDECGGATLRTDRVARRGHHRRASTGSGGSAHRGAAQGVGDLRHLACRHRRGIPARFTFDPGLDTSPLWSRDGRRVVFASRAAGSRVCYRSRHPRWN